MTLLQEGIYATEQWTFQPTAPPIVDSGTENKNQQDTQQSMNHQKARSIPADIVERVTPQPLTHRVAVGMNQEHTKSTCTHCIDERTELQRQVFKVHESANGCDNGQYFIGICHKIKIQCIDIQYVIPPPHKQMNTLAVESVTEARLNLPQVR